MTDDLVARLRSQAANPENETVWGLADAADEIERLRGERDEQEGWINGMRDLTTQWRERAEKVEAERDALRGEIARLTDWSKAVMEAGLKMSERAGRAEAERDALRALLLRARDCLQHHDCLPCPGNCEGCTIEAAIDAAMKEGK